MLGWASANGGIALIDERAATRLARRDGIDAHGSLWLVVNGLRSSTITRQEAESIVDDLVDSGMALPTDGSDLLAWAYAEGLLP